jgi:hypothetical protein
MKTGYLFTLYLLTLVHNIASTMHHVTDDTEGREREVEMAYEDANIPQFEWRE